MDELFLAHFFPVYFYEIMQDAIRLKIIIVLFLLFKINIACAQGTVFHTISKWGKEPGSSVDTRLTNSGPASIDSVTNRYQIMQPIRVNNKDTGSTNIAMRSQKIPFSYPLGTFKITSHFGYRVHPVTGNNRVHSGVDLQASYEPVFAVFPGVIEETGRGGKEGYYMIVKHSKNIKTVYCHLSKMMLRKGDLVRAGQVIAISGNTGQSTGPHLHFAVRFKEAYIDPVKVFDIFQD